MLIHLLFFPSLLLFSAAEHFCFYESAKYIHENFTKIWFRVDLMRYKA